MDYLACAFCVFPNLIELSKRRRLSKGGTGYRDFVDTLSEILARGGLLERLPRFVYFRPDGLDYANRVQTHDGVFMLQGVKGGG